MPTNLASTAPRTTALAVGRPRKMPVDSLPNRAGQTGTVTTKMRPMGIVKLAMRKM